MYECLVGEPPFEAADAGMTYQRILSMELHIPSHVSTQAQALLRQILQKCPQDRPTLNDILAHPWITLHSHHHHDHDQKCP
jgi:aurora kinase